MRPHLPLAALLLVPLLALAAGGPAPRAVPRASGRPRVDGRLEDLAPAAQVQPATPGGPSASWRGRMAWRGEQVRLGVEVRDDAVLPSDALLLTLYFRGVGPTATGRGWRFGADGRLQEEAPATAPAAGTAGLQHALLRSARGFTLEATLSPRALPRLPARGPLVLDACLTYEDRDPGRDEAERLPGCQGGTMVGAPLRLPDAFRAGLGLTPPAGVHSLERRDGGWLGLDERDAPAWVRADVALTAAGLAALLAPDAVEPAKVGLTLPPSLALPDGRLLLPVVSGRDPFSREGGCEPTRALRLALFEVKERTARRVLEWPAATCALGRVESVLIDEDGSLTIGYTGGATVNFAWSGDHFERTEMGLR